MTFTSAAIDAINARETGEFAATLLTIRHADLAEPIRLCDCGPDRLTTDPLRYGLTSNGLQYTYLPMAITLPDSRETGTAQASITLDNTSRDLVALLRSIAEAMTVEFALVVSTDLDDQIEFGAPMAVRTATINANTISLEILGDQLTGEPFPAPTFNPIEFPGMFQ